jgi:hypothetical protein
LFTKHRTTHIFSQKGCKSSSVVSFNQLYISWGRTLKKKYSACVSLGPKPLAIIKMKLFENLPYILVTTSLIVPSSCKSCYWMKLWMEWITTKWKLNINGSICSIIVVVPNFKTNDQSPFSNLFQNVTPKFWTWIKDPTLKQGENVVTKVALTIRVTIRNLTLFVRSQCMNLYPLLTTSYDPYLFNI